MLTNNIVSFKQLGPGIYFSVIMTFTQIRYYFHSYMLIFFLFSQQSHSISNDYPQHMLL